MTDEQPQEIVGVPGSAPTQPVWFQRSDGTVYCAGDGIPESGQHVTIEAPEPTARQNALAAISALEAEQGQRLTPRALRELFLGILVMANQQGNPAFAALKAIDDKIRAERAKL